MAVSVPKIVVVTRQAIIMLRERRSGFRVIRTVPVSTKAVK